jgi:hypothetical protein
MDKEWVLILTAKGLTCALTKSWLSHQIALARGGGGLGAGLQTILEGLN